MGNRKIFGIPSIPQYLAILECQIHGALHRSCNQKYIKYVYYNGLATTGVGKSLDGGQKMGIVMAKVEINFLIRFS